MNCPEVRERLDEFIDGRLTDSDELEVLKHLESCANCSAERERLAGVVTLVREIPQPAAPDRFVESVLGRLAPVSPPRGRLLAWAVIPVGLAASFLLAVFLIGDWQAREADPASGAGTLEIAAETRSSRVSDESGLPGEASPPAAPPRGTAEGLVSGAVSTEHDDTDWGEDTALTYVVRGAHPDATAGVLLAELNHRRSRGASRPKASYEEKEEADDLSGERLESDERGEPETMVLYLTPAELDYLLLLLRERRDARVVAHLAPQDGPLGRPAGESSGDDSAPGRRRVLLRFER